MRAMTPVVQREREYMSLASNNKFGPEKPMAVLRVFKIVVGVMFYTYPPNS